MFRTRNPMILRAVPVLVVGGVSALAMTGVTRAADSGLMGWWKLDDGAGALAMDSSVHGNSGTLTNGPVWVAGKIGGALRLDGRNQYVECGNGPSLNVTDQITLAVWINPSAAGNGQHQHYVTKGDKCYALKHNTGNYMEFDIYDRGWFTARGPAVTAASFNGVWHHVAGTYDGKILKMYIDGELQPAFGAESHVGHIPLTATSVSIGRDNDAGGRRYYNGLIDDVRIYNRALSQEEIVRVFGGMEDVLLAWNPRPADGSTPDMDEAAVLRWSAWPDVDGHDVYFGSDREAVEQASPTDGRGVYRGRQTSTTHYPSEELAMGQRYYWRIDEMNQNYMVQKGEVWSFTVAEYLVVDGFEGYDDACNQIWLTWHDGTVHVGPAECGKAPSVANGTGSVVGNSSPPYAERTIVRSGHQSMPLTYNNSRPPFYSEAERTFDPPADWTRFDVNTLTLYVRGDPGNALDALYVGVEDSAQHAGMISHADQTVVTKPFWKRCDIPLGDPALAGVDLRSVKRIVVGVGDWRVPKAAGKGKLYVDDIRLVEVRGAVRPVAHWEFEDGSGDTAADSAGSNDGIVMGAKWVPGKIGNALWFDGIDDSVECGHDSSLNPAEMTLSLWVCPERKSAMRSLVSKASSGIFEMDYNLQLGIMGGLMAAFSDGSEMVVVLGAKVLATDAWSHVAFTRDGSEAALYINGSDRTGAGYSLRPGDGGYLLRIGGPSPYQGKIDEVKIYDRALGPDQIEQIAAGQL